MENLIEFHGPKNYNPKIIIIIKKITTKIGLLVILHLQIFSIFMFPSWWFKKKIDFKNLKEKKFKENVHLDAYFVALNSDLGLPCGFFLFSFFF